VRACSTKVIISSTKCLYETWPTALKDINGNITSVVFDGVITQRIVDIASEKGISNLVGAKIGNLVKTPHPYILKPQLHCNVCG